MLQKYFYFLYIDVENNIDYDNYTKISNMIYKKYGIIIIDSYIDKYMNNIFINFPTNCIILFDKKWETSKKINNKSIYKKISFNQIIVLFFYYFIY